MLKPGLFIVAERSSSTTQHLIDSMLKVIEAEIRGRVSNVETEHQVMDTLRHVIHALENNGVIKRGAHYENEWLPSQQLQHKLEQAEQEIGRLRDQLVERSSEAADLQSRMESLRDLIN